jgi:tRNA(Ile)-lysidine synthase
VHPLEKHILELIKNNRLLAPGGGTVVVAVSGGPDSICLLHLLARLTALLGIRLVAAHLNHGLRPDEAGEEALLVKKTAGELRVAFEQAEADVRAYARKNHLSIEHAGRVLRYEFLDRVAAERRAHRIALAHTADDQIETILLHLIRGTARKGLSGMKALHRGRYIRPLLTIPKTRLLEYLDDIKANFADDSSNRQRAYLRNRIRLDLLPYLEENFNPNIRQTLQKTAEILRDEEKLLAAVTAEACATIIRENGLWQEISTPDKGPVLSVDLAEFIVQPRAIQRRILETACLHMHNTPYFQQIGQLLHLACRPGAGGIVHLARGLRVVKSTDQLLFFYPQGKVAKRGNLSAPLAASQSLKVEIPGPGKYQVEELGLTVEVTILDRPAADFNPNLPDTEFLDLDRISLPLLLRTPELGDRFHPLGSPGSKKVSDFFTDQKIPVRDRRQIPVLLAGNRIVALLGLRIDHDSRVTSATTKMLRIQWTRVSAEA